MESTPVRFLSSLLGQNSALLPVCIVINLIINSQTFSFPLPAMVTQTLLELSTWPPWHKPTFLWSFLLVFVYFLMRPSFSLNDNITKWSPCSINTPALSAQAGVLLSWSVDLQRASLEVSRCHRSCHERCSPSTVCKALLMLASSVTHFICTHISN